jgi:hypothetical protein
VNRPHRPLGHTYADEIPPPRPPVEPVVTSWREAVGILLQAALILLGIWAILSALLILGGS